MDWKTCVLVIVMAVSVDADCASGVQGCLNTYMQTIMTHPQDKNALCNDIDAYTKCVFSQGCSIGSSQKQAMIDTTKSALSQLNCPFTMEQLINRYGNSASLLSPINTTLIMIMSFILLILNSWIF